MNIEERVAKLLEEVETAIKSLRQSIGRIVKRVSVLQDDVDILYESQDMNVWVLLRGIQQGDIAPGEDPEDMLRAVGKLQAEYKAVIAIQRFLREMSRRSTE